MTQQRHSLCLLRCSTMLQRLTTVAVALGYDSCCYALMLNDTLTLSATIDCDTQHHARPLVMTVCDELSSDGRSDPCRQLRRLANVL
eukprot:1183224-Rhodomonas_salina.1